MLKTRDQGVTWKAISPDLTQRPGSEERNEQAQAEDQEESSAKKLKTKEAEETVKPPNRTAINTFSPSPMAAGLIWAGTTNGLIQVTRDAGKSWKNVTPTGLSRYALISILEASHFDAAVAYAAVDRHEENDFRPHLYRTRDFGESWQEIVAGIADGDLARVVREDPTRKGLLYAGTENAAYVSLDDGGHWNSLRLNMPVTSVRDLAVRGDDLVAATYGRAFWILDDLAPLRQIDSKSGAVQTLLYKPGKAIRVRLDLNQDTPLPPEMPAGDNPPNGALIDYYLKTSPSDDIQLAIYDQTGQLVRQYSSNSADSLPTEPLPTVPDYWLARPEPLSRQAGMNRFVWDLRYSPPLAIRHEYPISALYQDTPGEPLGAIAKPGRYEVRLTVNGEQFTQPLDVVMDPRVDVSTVALTKELALERKVTGLVNVSYNFYHHASEFRKSLAAAQAEINKQGQVGSALESLKDLDGQALKITGSENASGPGGGKPKPTFALLNRELGSLAATVDGADAAPTPAMQQAFTDYCQDLSTLAAKWSQLMTNDAASLNAKLSTYNVAALPASGAPAAPACQ